jgi:hypothetical protein
MAVVIIKGREYAPIIIRDSFNRRATQYVNMITTRFKKAGLSEDDFDIPHEAVAFRKAPASVSWYVDGRHLHYSFNGCAKYVENLYVVMKVMEKELDAVFNNEQTLEEYVEKFAEQRDIVTARKEARETLGVPENSIDIDEINRAYKKLAVEHHPDKEGGDVEKFKKINNAHKLLKRELS